MVFWLGGGGGSPFPPMGMYRMINVYCRYGSVGGVGGAAEDAGYDYAAGPAEGASSSSPAAAASTTTAPESQDYSYAGEEEGGDYAEDEETEKATTTTVALPRE